ncbi:MCE family protein [Oscillatoria sp. FACHB-1407]|uniref:MlaD family protein n=1 Tax=Oscillatoria sp. FACHB-1407 TaxID=2692847 RepID=UPI001681EACD|nr:MlaD family protein [Oscillatoria sp. FACHB-1407]MBD2463843.1 MCE family protein [Oscillatoria sp. FACHB-1407]
MRSRTIREGSVGLLILLGLGLFGLMVIWIRGLNPGNRSYRFIVEFANVGGMRAGAPVRYRGVNVGKITSIMPGSNVVDVEIEITPANLLIPRDATVEANQAGLIGETAVDITPVSVLPAEIDTNPLAADCAGSPIICDGDRLEGLVGVNFNELISATVRLTNLVTDPEFFGEIRTLARNTSDAAAGVATLSREVTRLTRTADRELAALSSSASATTRSVGLAADRFGLTANEINSLLAANRITLVSTLDNLNVASEQLQVLLSQFSTTLDSGEFIENLEILSANAAQASTNLRVLSESVGTQDNLLLLQRTLDSARATFENAQKITADLDELTGDPEFRQNIRDLVDGLSSLVSSTQQLEQQTELAQMLASTEVAQNAQSAEPATNSAPTYTPQDQLTPLNPNRRVRLQPYTVTNSMEREPER